MEFAQRTELRLGEPRVLTRGCERSERKNLTQSPQSSRSFKKQARSVQLEPSSGSMFLAVGETHGEMNTQKRTSSNNLFLSSSC